MNTDLISREALKEALAREIKTNDMGLWLKILLVIDNAPPVDPVRPQGEWVILPPCCEEICYCTNCGKMFKQMLQFTKECPNCHAYMKGIKK